MRRSTIVSGSLCALRGRRCVSVPRRQRVGAGARLAVRAAAPFAARARHQVSALRDSDAAERVAGRRGAASRTAGRQHADDRRHGQRVGPERQARARASRRVAARPGNDHASRRKQMNDAIDSIGGADGRGRGERPQLRQHGRDEGQLRARHADAVRHGRASGVRPRGDRSAAPAAVVAAARQPRGSRSTSRTPCSIGSCTASTRTGCRTAARRRRWRGSRGTICSRSIRSTSCRTTPSSRLSAT